MIDLDKLATIYNDVMRNGVVDRGQVRSLEDMGKHAKVSNEHYALVPISAYPVGGTSQYTTENLTYMDKLFRSSMESIITRTATEIEVQQTELNNTLLNKPTSDVVFSDVRSVLSKFEETIRLRDEARAKKIPVQAEAEMAIAIVKRLGEFSVLTSSVLSGGAVVGYVELLYNIMNRHFQNYRDIFLELEELLHTWPVGGNKIKTLTQDTTNLGIMGLGGVVGVPERGYFTLDELNRELQLFYDKRGKGITLKVQYNSLCELDRKNVLSDELRCSRLTETLCHDWEEAILRVLRTGDPTGMLIKTGVFANELTDLINDILAELSKILAKSTVTDRDAIEGIIAVMQHYQEHTADLLPIIGILKSQVGKVAKVAKVINDVYLGVLRPWVASIRTA